MFKNARFIAYAAILAVALAYYFMPRGGGERQPPAERAAPIALAEVGSLNVRREPIQTAFERAPFRLTFEYLPLEDGRSRMVGRTADGLTTLELVGPPEALTTATLMAAMPADNKLAQVRNLNALMNLAELALPNWPRAEDWVSDNIPATLQTGRTTTTMGGNSLTMNSPPNSQTVTLTIAGPPKETANAAP